MFKPFELSDYVMSNEFSTPHVLCVSDAEPFTVEELFQLGDRAEDTLKEFTRLGLGYTPTDGISKLRDLIAKQIYLEGKIKSNNVVVHGGGSNESIWTTTFGLLNPGDHVIVQSGYYYPLYEVPRARECELSEWDAELEGGKWGFSFENLKKLIRKETKMLIVNHPHNPCGFQFTEDQKASLVQLAKEHNLILLSDEIYRWSNHDGSKPSASFCELGDNILAIGGLSKSFGLPGLRIGWITSQNLEYLKAISQAKSYGSVCPAAPSQFLASFALEHRDAIVKRSHKITSANLKLIVNFIAKYSDYFAFDAPSSGSIGLITLKAAKWSKLKDAREFCFLAKDRGILIAPGDLFHVNNHTHYNWSFRIGFGRRNFAQNWKAFEQFVIELISKGYSVKGHL